MAYVKKNIIQMETFQLYVIIKMIKLKDFVKNIIITETVKQNVIMLMVKKEKIFKPYNSNESLRVYMCLFFYIFVVKQAFNVIFKLHIFIFF